MSALVHVISVVVFISLHTGTRRVVECRSSWSRKKLMLVVGSVYFRNRTELFVLPVAFYRLLKYIVGLSWGRHE